MYVLKYKANTYLTLPQKKHDTFYNVDIECQY